MNALVPVERHTIFSPRHQAAFLENLSTSGNVRLACRAARVSPQTAYRARRSSPALARAWDAALLAARHVAEEVLADRALNGVEEAVFYHGEEIATRRRYDSRLLLAHLARLDALAERAEVAAALPLLDDQIEGLRRGEDLTEPDPFVVDPAGQLCFRQAQDERGRAGARSTLRQAQDERGRAGARSSLRQAQGDRDFDPQDPVPCVPFCRDSMPSCSEAVGQTGTPSCSGCEAQPEAEPIGRTGTPSCSAAVGPPCKTCGGQCTTPGATLTPADCMWLGNRLDRMDAARPAGALEPYQMGGDPGAIEALQLLAFEAGEAGWWLLTADDQAADAMPTGLG